MTIIVRRLTQRTKQVEGHSGSHDVDDVDNDDDDDDVDDDGDGDDDNTANTAAGKTGGGALRVTTLPLNPNTLTLEVRTFHTWLPGADDDRDYL